MAEYGNENLKINTVSGAESGDFAFSPEEMLPIEVAEALDSDLVNGKTLKQVKRARRTFGTNETRPDFRLSFRESLKNQFKGLTGLFLIISSFIMYLYRPSEPVYLIIPIVIALIMLLNAFAEYRASIALRLPKKYSSLKTRVVRNGDESFADSRQLVPGDIIFVEEGAIVPADCRIIDDFAFSVMETHVSGEDGSVAKNSRYVARNGPEVISQNMIYAGSIVTSGSASAIVCRTGKNTLTRRMRSGRDEYTPTIIKYVTGLCRFISVASVLTCFALLFIGVFAGADITNWFICALSIGASSLCDSMVSLCAASLGFGARKMAEDGMVIKNYGCIQTLAAANTIMCGKNLAFPPKRISLAGMYLSGKAVKRDTQPDDGVEELLRLMLVCSDAKRVSASERKQRKNALEYEGTPIDNAVAEYFKEWGKPIGAIRQQYIRMDADYTNSGDIARLLALHESKNTVIIRGVPENVLSRCVGYTLNGTDYKLSDYTVKKILTAVKEAAASGSILIAIACGETESDTLRSIDVEDRLIFKGFVAFSSSLDAGVAQSVYHCENAGIETVLSSNDAYFSALSSAKSAGIISDESQILTSEQLRSCSHGLLVANCPYYRLFLNVDDEEWLKIVTMRRESGRITAVTAERISELPLMNEADVSIVPESSCDTLRQTADAMLLGSGINLIADGILNAKTICRRIGAVVKYLPVGMIMMLVASVFSICYNQTPALRAQDVLFGGIMFNLAFAFSLAFEPRSVKNLRDKFPFTGEKPSINDFIHPLMFAVGGGIVLFVCSATTQSYTCALITLSLMLFLFACSVGGHGGIFATRRFGNRLLYICGIFALAVIALLMLTPFGQAKLGYGIPGLAKLIISLVLGVGYCVTTQIMRFFMSEKDNKKDKKPKKVKRAKKAKQDDEDLEDLDDEEYEEEYEE